MNDAQSKTDSQGDGANYRAPDEVALMHLTQQRKHQQPRSGDRNQHPRVAIAYLSSGAVRAQRQCAKVEQAQGPLQSEIQRSKMKYWILQRPAKLGEKRWKIVTRADDKVGVVLAAVQKTDLQPRETSASEGANHKHSASGNPADPGNLIW